MFKVGDTVKILKDEANGCCYKKGHIGKITEEQDGALRVGPEAEGSWVQAEGIELVRTNFKAGDTIRCVRSDGHVAVTKGRSYLVVSVDGTYIKIEHDSGKEGIFFSDRFELIKEAPMTLEQRINAVEGWTKEADDILTEIQGEYEFVVENSRVGSGGTVAIFKLSYLHIWIKPSVPIETFEWREDNSACIKNDQFKQALHWLRKKHEEKNCPKEGDKAEVKVNDQRWEATLIRKL